MQNNSSCNSSQYAIMKNGYRMSENMNIPPAYAYPKINDPVIGLFVRKWKWSDTRIILFVMVISSIIMVGAGSIANSMYNGTGGRISAVGNIGFILVWILLFLPLLWGMYLWQIRATKRLLETLREGKVISDKDSKRKTEIAQIETSLFQRLTKIDVYLIAIVLQGIFWYYELIVAWPQQFNLNHQYWYDVKWYFPLHVLAWEIGLYALSMIIVRHLIIVLRISKFIQKVDFQLEILHPDSAGGIGIIGDFIKTSSLFAIGLGAIAAIYALEVSLVGSPLLERYDVLGFFIIYLGLVPICLIYPLTSTQRSMLKARNKILEPIAQEFQETLQMAQSKITEISTEEIKGLNERLDQLQKHREIILQNYPVSPLLINTLRTFSVSAALPIVSGVTSIALQIFGK
jgi:hypothetical protein